VLRLIVDESGRACLGATRIGTVIANRGSMYLVCIRLPAGVETNDGVSVALYVIAVDSDELRDATGYSKSSVSKSKMKLLVQVYCMLFPSSRR
jgi:hypothetical protein